MKLTTDLKRALDALAFAHAADYLSQREKEGLLTATPQPPMPPDTAARSSAPASIVPLPLLPQVALVADTTLSNDLLHYAIDTCRHSGASLIVVDSVPRQATRLAPQLAKIRGANLHVTVTPLADASMEALDAFAISQPRLLFVIVSGASARWTHHSQGAWRSAAPLVVVSEQCPSAVAVCQHA